MNSRVQLAKAVAILTASMFVLAARNGADDGQSDNSQHSSDASNTSGTANGSLDGDTRVVKDIDGKSVEVPGHPATGSGIIRAHP